MLESCYRPLERCFGGGGDGDGDGLLWHMDLKPHASGDYSIAVVQANSSLEDQGQVFTSPSATYVGVYDGHGGPEASRFINSHLFPYLHSNHRTLISSSIFRYNDYVYILILNIFDFGFPGFALEQGGLSAEVIRRAFDATEEDFVHLVTRSWVARPQIASVGSCCLVGAITDDMLYVANLGDSRAVLGRRMSNGRMSNSTAVVAERLSTDHNVGVEEVRKEVEALHPDDAHIVVHTRGVWRIKGIIQWQRYSLSWNIIRALSSVLSLYDYLEVFFFLTVSRSIGDVYLKKPEFHRDPRFQQFGSPVPLKRAVMSAEPSILIRKLRPQDLFLIFASDGLWEQLSDDLAVEIVVKNPRVGIAKKLVRAALGEVARKREMSYDDIKRIKKGVRRHFHDDITVVVVYLDRECGSANGKCTVDCTSAPIDIFSLNSNEADDTPLTTY
ncbi:hypothetical protein RHGRI_029267 [Rhododendron griersonianum]|uniref:protein-serine/threonine phosphatase n=1 Tax=Rhododendron griersonianum TaxID=479676 RepID=A0AAV6INC7_9ERIC|nr:hypothetical protein RHGRI_029267 [Rhododendron griersonianum]